MTDLTEKWKAGELEWDREYYVDLEKNELLTKIDNAIGDSDD